MSTDPATLATTLTHNERTALRSLPARDRGHMPEDLWWAYYTLMNAGLLITQGDFLMVRSPLGEQVLGALGQAE